ncbi:DUF2779 domain-containing protein [Pedobacter terrae]|uniref:DUF2779 domain-containing protein n=1 Tax=Pedobacter terrae TaxID=405671 RepID=UPI002FF8A704
MSEKERYLTKSRFKLALECPAKLYYTGKPGYYNSKIDDRFLKALAGGGFQVGELAKCYFPGGHDIQSLDYETALAETNALLAEENVIIYEAAFRYENLFIRADIVVKKGNQLDLYEVKAKSIKDGQSGLTGTKGGIEAKWKPYVYDIAFQKYVVKKAFPDYVVNAYLILADKSAIASVDALNQKFELVKGENDRNEVHVIGDVSEQTLGKQLLCSISVDELIDPLYGEAPFDFEDGERSFEEWITFFSRQYKEDSMIETPIKAGCSKCEFKVPGWNGNGEFKSGYHECWQNKAGFSLKDFAKPSVMNIWDYRSKDKFLTEGRYFQSEISPEELKPKKERAKQGNGMSRVERQMLQLDRSIKGDNSEFIDKTGLKAVLESFTYPLHFIDFETCTVAIPFNIGRRPYEQIAFQFSHHVLERDGSIRHQGQWLNLEAGVFPNFEFLRALKAQLSQDEGTIFRYAAHENSVLNAIYKQLEDSNEADREALCAFIKTITTSAGSSKENWVGKRNMVDLRELVLKYYYSPLTNGSNSIKDVLPAILEHSTFIKDKYREPIYGNEIQSLNFQGKTWITFDESGRVINPYKTLESTFAGVDQEVLDGFISDEDVEISDGGAAMAAYAKMQFSQMGNEERQRLAESLLKYCELDTLAMVMIFEHWKNNIE